jgi:hypothetical protein
MGPAVDDLIKERGDLVKDYDSFQRRFKVLQGKKEQAAGKPSEAEMAGEFRSRLPLSMTLNTDS